ncbi:MAG: HAD hydrolase family protein, partial [Erysipelotrichaceae bacterium]|nr:HAD hydrolase family protein [Erysipelotrichaceae bacterium]
MKRKSFFFDIDGTLTDRKTGIIVPSAWKALKKLEEAGHFVSLCTGRAWYKAEWFRADHHFKNMVCNGGHGIVIDG